jgi:hypothetical protein
MLLAKKLPKEDEALNVLYTLGGTCSYAYTKVGEFVKTTYSFFSGCEYPILAMF